MKHAKHRLLGILAAGVLGLSSVIQAAPIQLLTPITASAAQNQITKLTVYGIEPPIIGNHPVTEDVSVLSNSNATIFQIDWFDNDKGKIMSSTSTFEAGKTYTLRVFLRPDSGSEFPTDLKTVSVYDQKEDDEHKGVVSSVSGYPGDICARFTYTPVKSVTVDSLLITGVERPYAGAHPVTTGVTVDESRQAEIYAVRWMEDGTNTFMKDTDVFEAGKDYVCKVYLEPKTGYTFPIANLKSMDVWFGRRSDESYADEVLGVYNSDTQICAENSYVCVEKPKTMVDNLLITGMESPKAGGNPVMKGITVDKEDQVTIVGYQWGENGKTGFLNAESVFEAGKEYYLDVYLEPKDGYTFPYSDLDSMSVWFSRRSDESYADSVLRVSGKDKQICVTNSYTCPEAKMVDSLLISGMDYPQAGKHPDTVYLDVDNAEGVSVVSFKWVEEGSSTALSMTDVFQAGKSYELLVYLQPKPGYTFPYDDLESMDVWFHKRSDESYADSVLRVHGKETQICATNSYYLPAVNTDSMLITGIDRPYAGAHPDTEGALDEPDQAQINDIIWYAEKDLGESSEWVPIADDAVFEVGKQYMVMVKITPKEGYTFPYDKLDSMRVWFDKLSDESYADSVIRDKNPDTQILVTNSYICVENPKTTVTKFILTGAVIPYDGNEPVVGGLKASDNRVDLLLSRWWDEENKEWMDESGNTFVKGKKYTLYVYANAKDGYTFPFSDLKKLSVYYDEESDATKITNVSNVGTQLVIGKTFTCLSKPANMVNELVLTGIVNPVGGSNPVFTGVKEKFDEEQHLSVLKVSWTAAASDASMTGAATFEEGKEYLCTLMINVFPEYQLPANPETSLMIYRDSINQAFRASSVKVLSSDSVGTSLEVTFKYTASKQPDKDISELTFKGVTAPVNGEHPTTSGAALAETEQATIKECYWIETGKSAKMADTDSFETYHAYILRVILEPNKGYAFDMKNLDKVKVNAEGISKTSVVAVSGSETGVAVDLQYLCAGSEKNISEIWITNIVAPIGGAHPVVTDLKVAEAAGYTIKEVNFLDENNKKMEAKDVFETGKKYTLNIIVALKDGYAFSIDKGDVKATVHLDTVAETVEADKFIAPPDGYQIQKEFTASKPDEVIGFEKGGSAKIEFAAIPDAADLTYTFSSIYYDKDHWANRKLIADYAAADYKGTLEFKGFGSDGLTEDYNDGLVELQIWNSKTLKMVDVRYFRLAEYLRGDVVPNKKIEVDDAQVALQAYTDILAKKPHGLSDPQYKAADVDQNGELSVDDAQYILQYYLMDLAHNNPQWKDIIKK